MNSLLEGCLVIWTHVHSGLSVTLEFEDVQIERLSAKFGVVAYIRPPAQIEQVKLQSGFEQIR